MARRLTTACRGRHTRRRWSATLDSATRAVLIRLRLRVMGPVPLWFSDMESMTSNTDISGMDANTQQKNPSGMRTIGVVGLASLSFLLVLSALGQGNDWLARVVIIGSLLMWAVMTWHAYQKD